MTLILSLLRWWQKKLLALINYNIRLGILIIHLARHRPLKYLAHWKTVSVKFIFSLISCHLSHSVGSECVKHLYKDNWSSLLQSLGCEETSGWNMQVVLTLGLTPYVWSPDSHYQPARSIPLKISYCLVVGNWQPLWNNTPWDHSWNQEFSGGKKSRRQMRLK